MRTWLAAAPPASSSCCLAAEHRLQAGTGSASTLPLPCDHASVPAMVDCSQMTTYAQRMRHLIGVVLAAVMWVAILFGASWAVIRLFIVSQISFVVPSRLPGSAFEAAAVAVATGVLAGVLLVLRPISPLATGLPGIALLAWSLLFLVSPRHGLELIPFSLTSNQFGEGFSEMLSEGFTAVIGAIFVIPLFVPSRWRGSGTPVSKFPAPSAGAGVIGYPGAPGGMGSGGPGY